MSYPAWAEGLGKYDHRRKIAQIFIPLMRCYFYTCAPYSGFWVRVSLLRSPNFFLSILFDLTTVAWMVFYSSRFFFLSLWEQFRVFQIQLVSHSPSWFTIFISSRANSNFGLSVFYRNGKKSTRWKVFFFFINTKSSLLASIWWFVCFSKSQRILWISFSKHFRIPFGNMINFFMICIDPWPSHQSV